MGHTQTTDALSYLRAEQEEPWLHAAFVAPPDFALMAGRRSLVVLGDTGAGKSAVRLSLRREAGAARYLIAEWRPTFPPAEFRGTAAVSYSLGRVFEVCMEAVVRDLAHDPALFHRAPLWVQKLVHWFIHRYLVPTTGDADFLLSRLKERASSEGERLLEELIGNEPTPIYRQNTPDQKLVADMTDALRSLGYPGVWVLVDELEMMAEANREQAEEVVKALLSSLNLFEDPQFALKIMAPLAFQDAIMTSSGVSRRRLDVHQLAWTDQQLLAIVESRLRLLLGRESFSLGDLYEPEEILLWLSRFGGRTPRGWLDLIQPFVEAYLTQPAPQPLSQEEWRRLQRTYPPPLRIDIKGDRVFLGYSEVLGIIPGAMRLLHYLYANRQHMCSRSELYYRAQLGLAFEPAVADPQYTPPSEWEGLLSTNIYRLRQALELDAANPLYIVTYRGKGVRLEHTR